MELLLVDPFSEVYINIPNMSLAYFATVFKAKVVDQHILPYPKDRFLRYRTNILGISVRSFDYVEAIRVAKKYHRYYPDAKIKSIEALDVQCCYPFLNLSEKISLNIEFSDQLPFPRYEFFDSFNYLSTNWRVGLWHYPLLTSLGCPFQCTFCASRNRPYKTRSVDNCIEELRYAKQRYKIVSFEIIDDVFNLNKARVIEFCKKVERLGLVWSCSNGLRADRFDEDQARALKSAGCRVIGFGIETIHDDILSIIKKGERWEHIKKAVEVAKRYFDEIRGYFIVGLPHSNFDKDIASIRWAKKMGIKPVVSLYVPESDTQDERLLKKGRIFYGHRARPFSDAYPYKEQIQVYQFSKKQLRDIYARKRMPLRLIFLTIKALRYYNFNSLMTHLVIGPGRFLRLLIKGEVQ